VEKAGGRFLAKGIRYCFCIVNIFQKINYNIETYLCYKKENVMYTYSEHYKKCLEVNKVESDKSAKYSSLYDVSVDTDVLDVDQQYYDIVQSLAKKASYKLDNNIGCWNGSHFVRYLNEWRDIGEVYALAEYIMPQLEQKVFHCGLQIEFALVYRNLKDIDNLEASWLWHYDDAPSEFLKFAVYLNDVDEDNGCFEYLVDENGEAPVLPSSRKSPLVAGGGPGEQLYKGSRIPDDVVQKIYDKGGKKVSLAGPPGTHALFNPNIMHRATVPKSNTISRDGIFFLIRPCLQKYESYINSKTSSILPKRNVKVYQLD